MPAPEIAQMYNQQGMSLNDIAQQKSLTPSTVLKKVVQGSEICDWQRLCAELSFQPGVYSPAHIARAIDTVAAQTPARTQSGEVYKKDVKAALMSDAAIGPLLQQQEATVGQGLVYMQIDFVMEMRAKGADPASYSILNASQL